MGQELQQGTGTVLAPSGWQRRHMRLLLHSVRVLGLVIKQKVFNGSVFMKVV